MPAPTPLLGPPLPIALQTEPAMTRYANQPAAGTSAQSRRHVSSARGTVELYMPRRASLSARLRAAIAFFLRLTLGFI